VLDDTAKALLAITNAAIQQNFTIAAKNISLLRPRIEPQTKMANSFGLRTIQRRRQHTDVNPSRSASPIDVMTAITILLSIRKSVLAILLTQVQTL
jgi:hypothetical protein